MTSFNGVMNVLVHVPHTTAELQNCESEYSMAGFPGCINSSTDATHIPLDKITVSSSWQAHSGYKAGSKTTTRTYNLTVNHCRQIIHTTSGHPGRRNEKTLIRFDTFMVNLHDGALDDMTDFTLKRRNEGSTAAAVTTGDGNETIESRM